MSQDRLALQLKGKRALSAHQLLEQNLAKATRLGLSEFVEKMCEQLYGHPFPDTLSGNDAIRFVEVIHPMIYAVVLQRRKRQ